MVWEEGKVASIPLGGDHKEELREEAALEGENPCCFDF